ncbi:hypothetical protein B7494_g906 [Chlorociboria aeruginascens]|nr:hypothetical protein B7494_g906 [Chlorociboria aeruginascens]
MRTTHTGQSKSKIDKLQILGIRSFDNQPADIRARGETITFNTPLTLIVGYNGSGKTTIIECLKYATTGQLPPNSAKGAAFVHDPKLCRDSEVLGQVRLGFRATGGARMVVTRSLQLTLKKNDMRSAKSLEGSLLVDNDGERTVVSKRVADLDATIPIELGVPVAILDNVIFCHQDESLWPMSEPSVLKKKFDEIFEALKYTKAIDNIKSLRKVYVENLAKYRHDESSFKVDKDKGVRAKAISGTLEAQIKEMKGRLDTLNENLTVAEAKGKEKLSLANEALGLVQRLDLKNRELLYIQKQVDELEADLEQYEESDEWLKSTLAQYEDRMDHLREQEQDCQRQYRSLNDEEMITRGQEDKKLAEMGHHVSQKHEYEKRIKSRMGLVRSAAKRHGIRGYDGDLEESEVHAFIEKMVKQSRDKDRELERVQAEAEDEQKKTQAALNGLEGSRTARIQDKAIARQTIRSNDTKANGLRRDVQAINIDNDSKRVLELSRNEVRDNLLKATAEYEKASWDRNLQTENNNLRELENEKGALTGELVQVTRLGNERAKLDFTRTKVKNLQLQLDTLVSTHKDAMTSVLGGNWSLDTLDREFQDALSQRTEAVADAKKQQDIAIRELDAVEYKIKNIRGTMKKKREDMERCHTAVLNSILSPEDEPLTSIEDYPSELASLETERDSIQKDLDGFTYVREYYQKCSDTVKEKNACRLCERRFADTKEQSKALEKIDKLLAKNAQEQLKADLESIKKELQQAIAVRSQYEIYNALSKNEIPTLEKELQKAEKDKLNWVARLENEDSQVREKETAKSFIEALLNNINTMIRLSDEISGYNADIVTLSSQQKLSGSSRTIEEIEEQISAYSERIRILAARIGKMATDKDRAKTSINTLERELSNASSKCDNAGYQLEKKEALLSQIKELEENNQKQQALIRQVDSELEGLDPVIAEAKVHHEDAQQRGKAKDKEIRGAKQVLSDIVKDFKRLDEEINRYLEEGGPAKLAACQRSIDVLDKDHKRIQKEKQEITSTANSLNKQISESDQIKRNMNANIKHRSNLRELEKTKEEITELESRNAKEDWDRLHNEARQFDKNCNAMKAEITAISASVGSKDEELGRYSDEYATFYKQAAQKYREAHINVETTKAVIEDLGKYVTALDAAIMKFHSIKMEEINRIAGELWQRTYQGTDVDTIMIRSENDNPSSKRNYNYRVVMVKQGAEMDMRGRCSAGQKVLASIIIRLALAECFGVNCGIIALDEPTTNLDRDNIRALASSLHKIIKERQQQANFQLIVITHDEEFLKDMNVADFCDNYWHVSRNDKQKSIIRSQAITDVLPAGLISEGFIRGGIIAAIFQHRFAHYYMHNSHLNHYHKSKLIGDMINPATTIQDIRRDMVTLSREIVKAPEKGHTALRISALFQPNLSPLAKALAQVVHLHKELVPAGGMTLSTMEQPGPSSMRLFDEAVVIGHSLRVLPQKLCLASQKWYKKRIVFLLGEWIAVMGELFSVFDHLFAGEYFEQMQNRPSLMVFSLHAAMEAWEDIMDEE